MVRNGSHTLWVAIAMLLCGGAPQRCGGAAADGATACSAAAAAAGTCRQRVPTLSIIYITMRPGGYDVLFESMAQQTSTDFELICIDDAGVLDQTTGIRGPPARRAAAVAYARRLGLPLVALVPSKKKVRGLRFGQCNAINSGLALASGSFITVVQDNVWLLPNFVERTLAFFSTHPRDVLLSYPERRIAPPPGRKNAAFMKDLAALHIFDPPVTSNPVDAGWEIQNFNNTMTEDIWGHIGEDRVIKTEWFECAACTASWELYAALNGLDEALDAGDDSQEANVKDRAVILSQRLRLHSANGGGGIEFQGLGTHWRHVLQVVDGEGGIGDSWNDLGSPVILIDHHQFNASDGTWARFERDTNVHRWRAAKDLIEFEEYPVAAPNNFDLAALRAQHSASMASLSAQGRTYDEHGVVLAVDWPSLLPALDVGEQAMAAVDMVMRPRFGYKPEVLFIYALEEEDALAWQDGLTRALREMRRHFHVTLMNIGHMRVEDQPEIDFQIKNTFHFFLGYGKFLGHADFFMRQYNDKMNPIKKQKGEQLVTFAMLLRGGMHYADEEAQSIYGAIVTDTPEQAAQVTADNAGFGPEKVFHQLGIDPGHWAAQGHERGGEARLRYHFLVVGDLSSATRPELLLDKHGTRRFVGRHVDATSDYIAEELTAGGVEVSRWVNASERGRLYRNADTVLFPMSEEGSGEMELLEALACGATVEIADDNERLHALHARAVEHGIPDHVAYATTLTQAVWSVLAPGANRA